MTYKSFRIGLQPEWLLQQKTSAISLSEVLSLLAAIDATGNITGACKACNLSYRHAWGTLRRFEALFGVPLLLTRRRQGTALTPFASRLLWANRRIEARLMPTLESMASELQEELERLLPRNDQPLRLHASHGFAVEALMQHMEGRSPGMELRYRTASEALASLERHECDLAGFQIPLGRFEPDILAHYLDWIRPKQHCLIHLAVRDAGLFVEAGNPKKIRGVADLARNDVRFVNRQIGSSTRRLTGLMLAEQGIGEHQVQGYDTNEFTHMAIAAHIASGMADVGIGVETAARRFGLDFIPLVKERYFFALDRRNLDNPSMQALLQIMQSREYRSYIGQLAGYDSSLTGDVQQFEDAFPGTNA